MNTCLGIEPVPGAIFRLVSFLKRLKAAFEHEPVNKVSTKLFDQQNIKTHFLILFFLQICQQHFKELKKSLDNNFALQAVPGK